MWRTATLLFVGLTILAPIGTEVVRSVVHRRREAREGVGGTQDVAMWGTLIGLASFAAAVLCGAVWYFSG